MSDHQAAGLVTSDGAAFFTSGTAWSQASVHWLRRHVVANYVLQATNCAGMP